MGSDIATDGLIVTDENVVEQGETQHESRALRDVEIDQHKEERSGDQQSDSNDQQSDSNPHHQKTEGGDLDDKYRCGIVDGANSAECPKLVDDGLKTEHQRILDDSDCGLNTVNRQQGQQGQEVAESGELEVKPGPNVEQQLDLKASQGNGSKAESDTVESSSTDLEDTFGSNSSSLKTDKVPLALELSIVQTS